MHFWGLLKHYLNQTNRATWWYPCTLSLVLWLTVPPIDEGFWVCPLDQLLSVAFEGKRKLHVDFSTCLIMPNGPERTMLTQTWNVMGVPPLGLPLPDVLSCGVLLCHLLPSHAGSLCWVVKVLLGNPPLKHTLPQLTVSSASTHSQVHFHLPGPALCCNATLPAKKRTYSFGFLQTPKTWNPF